MPSKKLRIDVSFEDTLRPADLIIPIKELSRIANFVKDRVCNEVSERSTEWKDFCSLNPNCLSIVICKDVFIRSLNARYRHLDKATDVLSFPTVESLGKQDLARLGEEISLGDLVISLETVERAARRVKRPVLHEFLEVYIHGLLHLWGYDHIKKKGHGYREVQRMRTWQSDLFKLAKIGIKTSYDRRRPSKKLKRSR